MCCIYLLPWETYRWVIFVCCFRMLLFKNILQQVGNAIIINSWIMFWGYFLYRCFSWHNIFLLFNCHPNPHLWVYIMDPRCFLYWQFPWYFVWSVFLARNRQKMPPKMWNEFVMDSFCSAISPMVSWPFREKWEAGVWNQGNFRKLFCVLSTPYIEIIL